jgi:hypothetical protein
MRVERERVRERVSACECGVYVVCLRNTIFICLVCAERCRRTLHASGFIPPALVTTRMFFSQISESSGANTRVQNSFT